MEKQMKGGTMEENSGTITIKKDSLWKYSTFVLLALVIVMSVVYFRGDSDSGTPSGAVVGNTPEAAQEIPKTPEKVLVEIGDDPVQGEDDASVTFIEFTDYQCPFCARQNSQTIVQMKSEFVENGKVRYVLKDFPLESIHPQAIPAANAANCVREKGKDPAYWDMHDKLFENQQTLSVANYKAWAKELGYNIDSCVDSEKFESEIRADLEEGTKVGIRGTPGSFILMDKDNADTDALVAMQQPDGRGGYLIRYIETEDGQVGLRISGALPYDSFKKAIEAGL